MRISRLQVNDVDFPLDEEPGDDEKGLTSLFKLNNIAGVVLRESKNNNAVIPKDQWEQRGVPGGYVRLAFVPASVTQACCYAYVYPAPYQCAGLPKQSRFTCFTGTDSRFGRSET